MCSLTNSYKFVVACCLKKHGYKVCQNNFVQIYPFSRAPTFAVKLALLVVGICTKLCINWPRVELRPVVVSLTGLIIHGLVMFSQVVFCFFLSPAQFLN